MVSRAQDVQKGSWRWSVRMAEITGAGTLAFVFLLLHLEEFPPDKYRIGLILCGALAVWMAAFFRLFLPTRRESTWLGWMSLVVNFGFAVSAYELLRTEVLSAHLIFVPVIAATALLAPLSQVFVAAAVSVGAYWGLAYRAGQAPNDVEAAINSGLFVLTGLIASLLSRQLRTHFQGEQEEHRLATAVRLRLVAVLDAVDEAIVFRDRHGLVRVVNQRAGELFQVAPDEYIGVPAVELLRVIARRTEDPEGFMETFQELRDEPELEMRVWIDQIIPERRQLRLYSGPTFDDSGTLVGRIDVYTDVSESVRRAAEIETLYEEARKTAESYQRSLLPDAVPTLPRTNIVAHYIPAAGRRAVCGDFYDFIPWPDGKIGVVLGDVCGVGPRAANDAAMARYTLRTLMEDEADPGRLFDRLNEHICSQGDTERFVRLLLGILDPERAVLEYVSAGHVPPVVYRAKSGEAVWLGEGGIALGVDPDTTYKVGRIELDPGDMTVMYTDGVTEAPRHGRVFGQAKLGDLIMRYGVGTPGELVQGIRRSVEAWVGTGELRDDLALLVSQVVPDALIAEPTRELVLPNEPARIGDVRAFVGSFLADIRAPVDPSHEVLLAVGEAAANAYRHGSDPNKRSEIRVRCLLEGPTLTVTIADEGPGFDPRAVEARGLPDRFASGGRGVFLMRELMDEVEFSSGPAGTMVTLKRRLFAS